MTTTATRTAFRTCPLCEAGCGLEIALAGPPGEEVVTRIRGDRADVFSHGFICPKSQGLRQLHDDPDRLTAPLVRRGGELVEASWQEAFEAVDRGLSGALADGGRDAVAVHIAQARVHVEAVRVELFLPHVHSLKEKRAVIKPIVEGARRRYQASVAEVDHQDKWQRATLGFAVVSSSSSHVQEVLDSVSRFVWSFPEVEVVDSQFRWAEQ